jgi:hypothetical protein
MTDPKPQDELRFQKVWSARTGEVLYVNSWASGWQALIFRSHASAAKWAARRGAKYTGPAVEAKAA